jgi:acyl-coenzyme A thioesterase PaaI-like protein
MGGELPAPPIFRLTGMRPTEAGLGKATFSMPVTRWLEDGFRLYWGGVYALFAETVHAGRQVGLSRIEVTDQEGRMLAFGSTRCLISEAAAGDRQQSLTWAQAQGPFRALLRRQGAP